MNGFISFKKVKSSFFVVRPFAWNRKPVNGIIPLQRHLVYFSTDTRILDFGATIVFLSLMNIRAISCHYYNLYYTCILVNKTLKYNRYVDQGWTDVAYVRVRPTLMLTSGSFRFQAKVKL